MHPEYMSVESANALAWSLMCCWIFFGIVFVLADAAFGNKRRK